MTAFLHKLFTLLFTLLSTASANATSSSSLPPAPIPTSLSPPNITAGVNMSAPLPLPDAPPGERIPSITLFLTLISLALLPCSLPNTYTPYFPLPRVPSSRFLRVSPFFSLLDVFHHLLTFPYHLYRTRSLRNSFRALLDHRTNPPPQTRLPARSNDNPTPSPGPLDKISWLLPFPAAFAFWNLTHYTIPRFIAFSAASWVACWAVNAALPVLIKLTEPDPRTKLPVTKPGIEQNTQPRTPPLPLPARLRRFFVWLGRLAFLAPHLYVLGFLFWSMNSTPEEDTYIDRFAVPILDGLFVWGSVLERITGGGWRPWVIPVPVVLSQIPESFVTTLKARGDDRGKNRRVYLAWLGLHMFLKSFVILLLPFYFVLCAFMVAMVVLGAIFCVGVPAMYFGVMVLVPGGLVYGTKWPEHVGWKTDGSWEEWPWWFLGAWDERIFAGQQVMWALVLCWGVYGSEAARGVWRMLFSWLWTM